jgi:hypothetical protein
MFREREPHCVSRTLRHRGHILQYQACRKTLHGTKARQILTPGRSVQLLLRDAQRIIKVWINHTQLMQSVMIAASETSVAVALGLDDCLKLS